MLCCIGDGDVGADDFSFNSVFNFGLWRGDGFEESRLGLGADFCGGVFDHARSDADGLTAGGDRQTLRAEQIDEAGNAARTLVNALDGLL